MANPLGNYKIDGARATELLALATGAGITPALNLAFFNFVLAQEAPNILEHELNGQTLQQSARVAYESAKQHAVDLENSIPNSQRTTDRKAYVWTLYDDYSQFIQISEPPFERPTP